MVLHLDSRFFHERTLKSLVYAAPFAAPLAYTGLGLLLVMNRMVDRRSAEWPRWVLLLALGGFVGNFVFSLTDHAQNGFYHWTEWIPVASSALAVGFLTTVYLTPVTRRFLGLCAIVLVVQVAVGLLGFVLHTRANLHGPSPDQFDNFVFGAPALAPLLFPNLVAAVRDRAVGAARPPPRDRTPGGGLDRFRGRREGGRRPVTTGSCTARKTGRRRPPACRWPFASGNCRPTAGSTRSTGPSGRSGGS